MQNNFKKLLLLPIFLVLFGLGFFAFSSEAQAADYYVSFSVGNDANPGTESQPIKYHPWMGEYSGNIALAAGDNIFMKRGDVWSSLNPENTKGFISAGASGMEGNLITTAAYGSGAKPLIRITASAVGKALVYLKNQSYLKFDNLELKHSITSYVGTYLADGILMEGGHHIYITDNEISYVRDAIHAPHPYYTHHLYIGDMGATQVATETNHSNYIHHVSHGGIIVGSDASGNPTESYAYYNYITEGGFGVGCRNNGLTNDLYGISFGAWAADTAWYVKDVYVKYNKITHFSSWVGIDSHACINCYFERNYIYDTAFGMAFATRGIGNIAYVRNNEIANPSNQKCIAVDETFYFIMVRGGEYVDITGNKLYYESQPANTNVPVIQALSSDGGKVENNIVCNGNSGGRAIIDTSGLDSVINNTIYNTIGSSCVLPTLWNTQNNCAAISCSDMSLTHLADVNSDTHINIKDIQACVKVITNSQTNQNIIDKCKVLAAPTESTNIKDIQEIVKAIIAP